MWYLSKIARVLCPVMVHRDLLRDARADHQVSARRSDQSHAGWARGSASRGSRGAATPGRCPQPSWPPTTRDRTVSPGPGASCPSRFAAAGGVGPRSGALRARSRFDSTRAWPWTEYRIDRVRVFFHAPVFSAVSVDMLKHAGLFSGTGRAGAPSPPSALCLHADWDPGVLHAAHSTSLGTRRRGPPGALVVVAHGGAISRGGVFSGRAVDS